MIQVTINVELLGGKFAQAGVGVANSEDVTAVELACLWKTATTDTFHKEVETFIREICRKRSIAPGKVFSAAPQS